MVRISPPRATTAIAGLMRQSCQVPRAVTPTAEKAIIMGSHISAIARASLFKIAMRAPVSRLGLREIRWAM